MNSNINLILYQFIVIEESALATAANSSIYHLFFKKNKQLIEVIFKSRYF